MTTQNDFLSGLRLRLRDSDGRRWPNDELLAYLQAAVQEYSKSFPRLREQQFVTSGNTRIYALPSDLIGDQIIEVAITGEGEADRERLVLRRSLVYRGTRWYEVVGQNLHFGWVVPAGLTVRVRYEATHVLPPTGDATIPKEDEEMIYVAAMAMAWQRLAGNDANLSRWKEEGRRDDSPIIPIHVDLWNRYRHMVDQKRGGTSVLRRVRKRWQRPVR